MLIFPYSVWGTQFVPILRGQRATGHDGHHRHVAWQMLWPGRATHGFFETRGTTRVTWVRLNLPSSIQFAHENVIHFETFSFGPQRGTYYQREISCKAAPNHIKSSHTHCQVQKFAMIG